MPKRKPKSYGFRQQLSKGETGVLLAKMVLRSKYPVIVDYDKEMDMQRRGIDLFVDKLGYIEVKSDFHDTPNFFLEVSVGPKPGTLDKSGADIICYIYPAKRKMYLLPRPHVTKWLRDNWEWCKDNDRVRTVRSHQGRSNWTASGVIINRNQLIRDIKKMKGKVIVISWDESEEVLAKSTWEGDNGES